MQKLLIDGIIYSLQKEGGISTVFNEIIKRLPKDYFLLSLYKKNNFKLNTKLNLITLNYRILERYRKFDYKFKNTIFHSTYYREPINKDVKIVQTVHDFIYEKYINGIKQNIHTYQKSKAIKNADIIICVSNNTKSDLLNYYGSSYENKCKVIYNAASEDFYNIKNIEKINQVLFIGQMSGYKNFNALVLAISRIGFLKLAVIGSEFTREEFIFLKKHIPNKFVNLGYLTNYEVNIQYNISFCLVYPSIYEGFGIPILEAMQSGCPVIAVNSSSIPEIIDPKYLMSIGSSEEIENSILALMNDDYRNECINYGLKKCLAFHWDKTYNQTYKIYNSLL